jgi:16S rRNA (guanine(527)-N(7))-methyltransferase RsmG
MTFQEELERACGSGWLSSQQIKCLAAHYELLLRWNRTLNLTKVRSLSDIVRLHYCESLALSRILPRGHLRIADVGSGAGFPGIPLAVARPDCAICLVESHHRKAVFLREATRGLCNAHVFVGRAEETRENFDWLVARAVNPQTVLDLSLAPSVALLLSSASLGEMPSPTEIIPLTSSRQRIIALFHVEHAKINGRG